MCTDTKHNQNLLFWAVTLTLDLPNQNTVLYYWHNVPLFSVDEFNENGKSVS